MKLRYIIGCLLLTIPVFMSAQKHDRNWVMGSVTNSYPAPLFETVVMKHNETGIIGFDTLPRIPKYHMLTCSASYSDKEGNLLYYSNGKTIYNIAGQIMENGDSINFGQVWTQQSNGYGATNCIIPIQDPGNPDSFSLLIHSRLELGDFQNGLSLYLDRIMYSRIDLYANGGLGKVTEKNVLLAEGVFETFTMIRHANGRDWWILTADKHYNTLRSFLINGNGIIQSNEQVIGPIMFDTVNNLSNGYGFLVPSHDGRFMARVNIRSGLWVFEFDRCTGMFIDYKGIQFEEPLWLPGEGVVGDFEFSPSGQYLYLVSSGPCYQIDLWKDSIELVEMEIMGEPKAQCNTGRKLMQLAPDGKIYISPGTSSLCMHIIHYPDLPWPECQFIINDVELPVYNHGSLVHYPNYRLGALEGSPCDTIENISSTVEPPNPVGGFDLYPNPASHEVMLELNHGLQHDHAYKVTVWNTMGIPVYSSLLPAWAYLHRIPVHNLPSGLYIVELRDENGRVLGTEKLVVD